MAEASGLRTPLLVKNEATADVGASNDTSLQPDDAEAGGDPVVGRDQAHDGTSQRQKGSFLEILSVFGMMGWAAFGGPTAHIAFFHKALTGPGGWMSEDVFVELLALCQAMPGPSSTQMSFAMGILQKGIAGGLFSGFLFQYPGLLLMSAAGFGAAHWLVEPTDWTRACSSGLSAAAVALVAEAAIVLGQKLCTNKTSQTLCAMAALLTFYAPSQLIFPLLMLAGGITTIITEPYRSTSQSSDEDIGTLGLSPLAGGLVVLAWLAILVSSVVAVNVISYQSFPLIHWFEAFFFTGSVTYGGGQVMLPLLEHVVVKYDKFCPPHSSKCVWVESNSTWVTEEQFLTGLALAQAMPGPLFNFAAYLGAIVGRFPGIAACWLGLFGPGILLIFGVLPFWGKFRTWALYRRAIVGLNSTAIGFIFASVFSMGIKGYAKSPFPDAFISIGIFSFWSSSFLKASSPVTIIGGGVLGGLAHWLKLQ